MKRILYLTIAILLTFNSTSYAILGNNGYEGGISSGGLEIEQTGGTRTQKQTYDYSEVVFVTGKPTIFEGKLTVNRSVRNNNESITYNYALTHGESDRLNRNIILDVQLEEKNNQTIRKAVPKSRPTERITIDGTSYALDAQSTVDFSASTITDNRPAADYFAGNWNGKKVYNSSNGEKITVTTTGKSYGYVQHWGSAEVQNAKVVIDVRTPVGEFEENWTGVADIKISSTTTKRLIYENNGPEEISFEGGYLQKQENNSLVQYTASLPEFDSKGIATDRVITYKDNLSHQSFPLQERLIVPELKKIKGHWYEKDVKELYSLEVYTDDANQFMPNQYMTRAEFAKAVVLAGKIEFEEISVTSSSRRKQAQEEVSPYVDVPSNHPYYKYVNSLYKNGTMTGVGGENFNPDDIITRAQALAIFIRILGFESIAPNPTAVTLFRDNDLIPDWARNSISVASYISIVKGDDYGYLNPNEPMTKAEASSFLNRLINYMRHDIVRDYRDRAIIY